MLAAVTESIRDKGLDDTPTAYWAALMATLELSSTKREEAVAVTAITYLLNLVSPQYDEGWRVFDSPKSRLGFSDGIHNIHTSPRQQRAACRPCKAGRRRAGRPGPDAQDVYRTRRLPGAATFGKRACHCHTKQLT